MSLDPRLEARNQLERLLPRAMEDERLDAAELAEMQTIFRAKVLTTADVKEVFGRYLKGLQDSVLADGLVTEEEQRKCRAAVRELKIPRSLLPPELAAIVEGQPIKKG